MQECRFLEVTVASMNPNGTNCERFLVCALCISLSVGSVAVTGQDRGEVVQGPKLKWDMSLWGKPRAGTQAADSLAKHVSQATGGNWTIVSHYGEALSKARENLDGIAIGAFEAAMVCNFYHPRKNPALMALTLPFLPIDSEQDSRRVREAVYSHPQVVKEFSRWNAMIYTSTFLPQYEFMGRGDAPLTLQDWRGLTVRAGGGVGAAMTLLGAIPTSSPATEVYTGVQQGTMDAASFPYTYGHVSYRIHEVSDWYTSNMSPGTADCPIVFSITAYSALPSQYQQVLADVKDRVIEEQFMAYQSADKVNVPILREGLVEVKYSAEQMSEFQTIAGKPVIDKWIADHQDDFDAQSVVDAIFAALSPEE